MNKIKTSEVSSLLKEERLRNLPSISIGGFTLSNELEQALAGLRLERKAKNVRVDCYQGGATAALRVLKDREFDVIVLEQDGASQNIIETIKMVAGLCSTGTKAIVVGQINDVELYRRLIECGVSDYLTPPFNADSLLKAISRIYADPNAISARSLAFFGAKGGVGASTIAQNVAIYAADVLNKSTILLDFDLIFGASSFIFDKPTDTTFQNLIHSHQQIDDQLLERILIKASDKLALLPFLADKQTSLLDLHLIFQRLIETAKNMASLVVVDLPHNWSQEVRNVFEQVDDVVVVAEPDILNLRDASSIITYLHSVRGEASQQHLILNKVGLKKRNVLTLGDFKQVIGLTPCGQIPFAPDEFNEVEEIGKPLMTKHLKSRSTKAIASAANILLSEECTEKPERPIQKFMSLLKGK